MRSTAIPSSCRSTGFSCLSTPNRCVPKARSLTYFDDPDAELTADFVGFRIVDSSLGEIGTVTDIDDTTANVLFVVGTDAGDTVYIPVAEEFIDAIDDDRQVIETTLPDGLVDLNAKKA